MFAGTILWKPRPPGSPGYKADYTPPLKEEKVEGKDLFRDSFYDYFSSEVRYQMKESGMLGDLDGSSTLSQIPHGSGLNSRRKTYGSTAQSYSNEL